MATLMRAALAACCTLHGALASGSAGQWIDLLPALAGADGSALLAARDGEAWTDVTVAAAPGPVFDLEAELQWRRLARQGGGFQLAVGPHAFGSEGYRVTVGEGRWGVVDSRGPTLGPGERHRLVIRVRPDSIAYSVAGRQVVRCPARHGAVRTVALRIRAHTEATMQACRLRALDPDAVGRLEPADVRFDYPPWLFPHNGRVLRDGGAPAVALAGAGRGTWLVSGQDAALPRPGEYEARFRIGGISHAGMVWLEVARSGGAPVARKILRLEELPRDGYRSVSVPFFYEGGWPMEYRVAAETGRLAVADIHVAPRPADPQDARAATSQRFRRTRALANVWGRAAPNPAAALRVVRLRRVLEDDGQYRFEAAWRLEGGEPIDDVGVDLWVATRSDAGRVRVFERSLAYDGVVPGPHATAARFDPERLGRYGAPVAFFAQLYWQGRPVAAGSRKWGIPVDDKYIVEAERTAQLDSVDELGEERPSR
jgi:hypothetical protein